tara:strand:+ start:1290 stop:2255 length:966 start_codon:yes stop_codon:yes gene_type:complete
MLPNPPPQAAIFVAIISFGHIGKAANFSRIWFESQTKSKFIAATEIILFSLLALTRIILLVSNAPLSAFVWTICAESLLTGMALVAVYSLNNKGELTRLKPKISEIKWMLSECWPLVLSGGLVLINFNLDKIMLAQIAGDFEVGIYTAATRLVESLNFIPLAVSASVAPALARAAQRSPLEYSNSSRKVYTALAAISILIGFCLFITSNTIINVLYGVDFAPSSTILSIHSWALIFVFHISFRTRLHTIEHKQRIILSFSCLTVLVNLVCNLLLIPRWGALGASWASLASWVSSALIFPLFTSETRRQMRSLIKKPRPSNH